MSALVYILCAIASLTCAVMLLRANQRNPTRLLFWSSVCFIGIAINNIILVIDLAVMPHGPSFLVMRNVILLISLSVFLYGLIWDAVV